jgi:hypothetical protein
MTRWLDAAGNAWRLHRRPHQDEGAVLDPLEGRLAMERRARDRGVRPGRCPGPNQDAQKLPWGWGKDTFVTARV